MCSLYITGHQKLFFICVTWFSGNEEKVLVNFYVVSSDENLTNLSILAGTFYYVTMQYGVPIRKKGNY